MQYFQEGGSPPSQVNVTETVSGSLPKGISDDFLRKKLKAIANFEMTTTSVEVFFTELAVNLPLLGFSE